MVDADEMEVKVAVRVKALDARRSLRTPLTRTVRDLERASVEALKFGAFWFLHLSVFTFVLARSFLSSFGRDVPYAVTCIIKR